MNFEPQKFFIGLMDFFSVLLPGALFTYLLMGEIGPVVLGDRYDRLSGAEAWAVFLFAGYLFGHLVFLLGSSLDMLYDWARRYTLNTQIAMLARRGRLLPWPVRALVWLVFKRERNLAVDRAAKIKEQALKPLQAKDSINTFQWCKALLNTQSPANLVVVQRFEADSKFFRCFTVVLLLFLFVVWPWQGRWPFPGVPLWLLMVMLLFALWRYMEQRFKATNQAYWAVITLTAQGGKVAFDKPAPSDGSPTHAGGVVFRMRDGEAQYLLIEAKDDPDQWVLPKGHIEESEHPRETAVREVHEETGVWASIGVVHPRPPKRPEEEREQMLAKRRMAADLGNVSYSVDGAIITVRFYLMEAVGCGWRKEKDRQHVWLPLDKAIARASHLETRELLQKAQEADAARARLEAAEQRRVRT